MLKNSTILSLAAVAVLVAAPAFAQTTAPVATQSATSTSSATTGATSSPKYTTAASPVGDLLDDPAAKAILDKYIPGFTTNEQVDMARAMTLKEVQQYAPDKITDDILAKIDAEFATLPTK